MNVFKILLVVPHKKIHFLSVSKTMESMRNRRQSNQIESQNWSWYHRSPFPKKRSRFASLQQADVYYRFLSFFLSSVHSGQMAGSRL